MFRYREHFLCRLIKYYEGENEWNFINDEGESVGFFLKYFILFRNRVIFCVIYLKLI